MIKKIWTWLVYSSENRDRISLTLKGVFAGLVTVGTVYAGLAHITLPTEQITLFVDALIATVQTLLMVISSLVTVFGLARKIYYTTTGEHDALNAL